MAKRATNSVTGRLALRRLATAGVCAATGADDAQAVGGALQHVGAFADLAGQSEVGDIL